MEAQFEPTGADFLADPYPIYRTLRESAPVYRSKALRGFLLTRYEDVRWSLTDARLSSDRITPFLERLPAPVREAMAPLGSGLARLMNFTDPPLHSRLRGLVGRAFVPSAAEKMRPTVETVTNELLANIDPSGFDFMETIANTLPVLVIGRLLGTPDHDHPRLKRWSDEMAALIGGAVSTPNKLERALAALRELHPYFRDLVATRRASPRDDLLSHLIQATDKDDSLTNEEIIATAMLLLGAGHETTTNLLGNGTWLLLQDPERWRRLHGDPSLLPSAIEEILRYECPTQNQGRIAREDLELRGTVIPKGAVVHCMIGSANRDPDVFEDAHLFDLGRVDNRHLAFGHGIHFCIGAPLARLEARVLFAALLERWGTHLQLRDTRVSWRDNLTFRGLDALALRVT